MFRRKRKKAFIDINFSPYRKRNLVKLLLEQLEEVEKKDLLFASLSLLSFISIFISAIIFDNLIEKKKREIKIVELQIRKKRHILTALKNRYQNSDKQFKALYISDLKEKIFYIWYNTYYNQRLWKAIKTYRGIVGSISPFIGFVSFPNPYFGFKPKLKPLESYSFHKVLYSKNIQNLLKSFKKDFSFEPAIYVEKFKVNPHFLEDLNKIRDSSIKANLLLQYGLIYNDLRKFKIYTPITVVFPLNIAFPSEELFKKKMAELRRFCNELIINKEYREELFINNKINSKTIVDGICIKNLF